MHTCFRSRFNVDLQVGVEAHKDFHWNLASAAVYRAVINILGHW